MRLLLSQTALDEPSGQQVRTHEWHVWLLGEWEVRDWRVTVSETVDTCGQESPCGYVGWRYEWCAGEWYW